MNIRTFASDNNAGIHPDILQAIADANVGHFAAYGSDPYTPRAIEKFKKVFGKNVDVFFVFGGTGANIVSLKACTDSFNGIICAETAHINCHEAGAAEKITGCKLLTIPSENGKITPDQIKHYLTTTADHLPLPKVISIAQSTELGTLYSPKEIKAIGDLAHKNNMFLHVDGARISNAVAALNVDIKEITNKAGVDIISFGGTKNGMMLGEAVVIFNKKLAEHFGRVRQQCTQLPSKMRFIAAQFEAFFTKDLWLKNARHANEMAQLLAKKLSEISGVKITQKVETNIIFGDMPRKYVPKLQTEYLFFEEPRGLRWVTSFDTTAEDIEGFVTLVRKTLH
ncbi:low specificity L-threonine aldolase [Candidatus Gracilibacteria bacterium]|nr:low specificity L-threonine aldolase [Candidatus Gracilibacteria bacterium]